MLALHERSQCVLEEYQTGHRFDLVTLRMVAEHLPDPAAAVRALERLVAPGGRVVLITVNLWSPITLLSQAFLGRFSTLAMEEANVPVAMLCRCNCPIRPSVRPVSRNAENTDVERVSARIVSTPK